jgi:hypothetical protein
LVACSSPGGAGTDAESRAHGVFPAGALSATPEEVPMGERMDDGFDWQNKGPLEFLEMLKSGPLEGVQFPCFTVWGVHRGWIQRGDIGSLLALGKSTEPCLAVVMGTSSFLPIEPSTVGQEALFMVLAYLEGEQGWVYGGYPARLTSTADPWDADELAARWSAFDPKSGSIP